MLWWCLVGTGCHSQGLGTGPRACGLHVAALLAPPGMGVWEEILRGCAPPWVTVPPTVGDSDTATDSATAGPAAPCWQRVAP